MQLARIRQSTEKSRRISKITSNVQSSVPHSERYSQSSTQETADSDQYDIRKSVLQGDVLSPWLFCVLMCYVLKIADEGRRDIAHPAEIQTGEESKECAACETQWYVRCRYQNEEMCKPCRTIRRRTS